MGGRLTGVLIAVSTLLSVALAVAVNVATGGSLPGVLHGYEWLAWPVVGLLAAGTAAVAIWHAAPAPAAAIRGQGSPPQVRAAELPGYIGELTGRDGEFNALLAAVPTLLLSGPGSPVILTISGQAGVGKTSLGLRLAHEVVDRYPDGQLWIELRGASAQPAVPDAMLRRVLLVLGLSAESVPEDVAARRALYRSVLADRRVLIFLDDAASAEQVRPLVPGARGCLVVVTSRRQLFLNATASCRLEVLDEQSAVELLALTAGRNRVAAEPAAARLLVERCGRLPLAVRIAGYRLQARPTWPTGWPTNGAGWTSCAWVIATCGPASRSATPTATTSPAGCSAGWPWWATPTSGRRRRRRCSAPMSPAMRPPPPSNGSRTLNSSRWSPPVTIGCTTCSGSSPQSSWRLRRPRRSGRPGCSGYDPEAEFVIAEGMCRRWHLGLRNTAATGPAPSSRRRCAASGTWSSAIPPSGFPIAE